MFAKDGISCCHVNGGELAGCCSWCFIRKRMKGNEAVYFFEQYHVKRMVKMLMHPFVSGEVVCYLLAFK